MPQPAVAAATVEIKDQASRSGRHGPWREIVEEARGRGADPTPRTAGPLATVSGLLISFFSLHIMESKNRAVGVETQSVLNAVLLVLAVVETERPGTKTDDKQQPPHDREVLHEHGHLHLPLHTLQCPEVVENEGGRNQENDERCRTQLCLEAKQHGESAQHLENNRAEEEDRHHRH